MDTLPEVLHERHEERKNLHDQMMKVTSQFFPQSWYFFILFFRNKIFFFSKKNNVLEFEDSFDANRKMELNLL